MSSPRDPFASPEPTSFHPSYLQPYHDVQGQPNEDYFGVSAASVSREPRHPYLLRSQTPHLLFPPIPPLFLLYIPSVRSQLDVASGQRRLTFAAARRFFLFSGYSIIRTHTHSPGLGFPWRLYHSHCRRLSTESCSISYTHVISVPQR
jgi:hypothetical protein